MLRKLIKYELMSQWQKYAVIYAVMLVLTVSFLLVDKGIGMLGYFPVAQFLASLLLVLFGAACVLSVVMVFIFTASHIYKNIFKDEGYLMHTLPVREWQHIATKTICCYIWLFVSAVVAFLCFLMLAGTGWLANIPTITSRLYESMLADGATPGFVRMFMLFLAFNILITPFTYTLYFYFCLAVGNLFNGRKLLMAVVTFVSVNTLSQIISGIFVAVIEMKYLGTISDDISYSFIEASGYINAVMIFSLVFTAVMYTAMAAATNYIMNKKLNLE